VDPNEFLLLIQYRWTESFWNSEFRTVPFSGDDRAKMITKRYRATSKKNREKRKSHTHTHNFVGEQSNNMILRTCYCDDDQNGDPRLAGPHGERERDFRPTWLRLLALTDGYATTVCAARRRERYCRSNTRVVELVAPPPPTTQQYRILCPPVA